MELGELIWIFHPPAPANKAKLVSIGLKMSSDSRLMSEIRAELERHKIDDLLPGHWSARQQTWFFNPELWTCLHSLLLRNNIRLFNLEPYMMLNSTGQTTDVLQCQHHPETYIIWLCDVWEEVMDKYQREMRSPEDLSWLKTQRERLVELRQKWMSTFKSSLEQSQSLSSLDPLSHDPAAGSLAGVQPANDSWLDEFEDEINDFYTELQNRQRSND